jgi:hypothetical protein
LVEKPEKQYAILESILQRQHSMLAKQDGKADRLFTILTVASGVIGVIGPVVFEKLKNAPLIYAVVFSLLLTAFFLLSFPMVYYVLRVSGPHIKPVRGHPKEWDDSVSFYGGILKMKPEQYEARMKKITTEDMVSENIRQIYILSGILDYKIVNLKKATKWLPVVFVLVVTIIFFGFTIYWLF